MKRWKRVILLFDLTAGLLFLVLCGLRSSTVAADSGMIRTLEERSGMEAQDVRKIAITFDDEVIIGLSQEICCIEAISLI